MLFLRYLLLIAGFGLFIGAAAILVYDLYVIVKGRKPAHETTRPFPEEPEVQCSWLPRGEHENPGLTASAENGMGSIPAQGLPAPIGRPGLFLLL